MQRPGSRSETKVDGGGARVHWSIAGRKKKARRKGGNERGTCGPIYKGRRISGMRENRGDTKRDVRRRGRLDFWRVSKERNLLRFGFCVVLLTGDVTTGYQNFQR